MTQDLLVLTRGTNCLVVKYVVALNGILIKVVTFY